MSANSFLSLRSKRHLLLLNFILMQLEERNSLVSASLILSVLGLLALALFSSHAGPRAAYLTEIISFDEGQLVRTSGTIESAYSKNWNVFMEICDGECVKAVIFEKDAKQLAKKGTNPYLLYSGQRVSLVGETQRYRGEIELVIREIELKGG